MIKDKSLVADIGKDTALSYTMDFSDGDGHHSDNGGNNQHNGQNGQRPRKAGNGKGYIPVIIFGLAFVVILVLMLYFFVIRRNSTSYTFTDTDLVYRIDADHDGKADYDEEGNPDFSKMSSADATLSFYDASENPNGVVIADNSAGDLAKILLQPSRYHPVITVQTSYYSENVYNIKGTFDVTDNNHKKTIAFEGSISVRTFDDYFLPIINHVTLTGSDNQKVLYYTANAGHYLISAKAPSNVSSWLVPLILAIVVIVFLIFITNRMYKSAGGSAGPGAMSGFIDNVARKQNHSKVRFADVAGCDEAKAELVEMVDYFHATDKYTRLGAKLPHGVLLVGPPGTGKTLLAKAVAGEASVPFFSISGSDFVEMYVGVGASRVRSLFKQAKQNAPCLIFIDEIDAVGRQRGAGLGGGNDEREQTLNELLVEMDGFEDNNGVIVMAATNRQDILDPALTRPGRFDRTITVDLPDKEGRAAILRVHARNKKVAPDVSFDAIAGRTTGFSGADLANIMNDAAILAVRANRSMITTADIDEAIDRAIAGPAKKSHLEENEKRQVAYHEAGHAVIGLFLPYSDKVQKITIIPRGRTGGHVLMTPEKDHFLLTKNQMLARITGYLGGRTSEEIFFGDVSTGASNDIQVATELARSMVTEYGMSDLGPIQYEKPGGSVFLGRDYGSAQANYSTQIAYEIDKALRQIIDDCHEKAREILTEHKADVELIANTLIQNETITADQIQYLLKNRKLPETDQHLIDSRRGEIPKNKQNIFLYTGYEPYYCTIDKILLANPSRLVIVVPGGQAISDETFRKVASRGAKDPTRIGVMTVSESQARNISLSIETFASHLESYAGVPVLLIKTNDYSLKRIEENYSSLRKKEAPKPKEAPNERPGVVKEILPSDKPEKKDEEKPTAEKKDETTKDDTSDGKDNQ